MLQGDTVSRDLIAEAIRSVIDEVVKEHFDALTQEHQLTSRICGALEARLRRLYVLGHKIEVVTQEAPDKGRGTLEKRTGIDLYIGIRVENGKPVSKGLFVQAKWKEAGRSTNEQRALVDQCKKLNSVTDDAHVWLYGQSGVEVVPASEIEAHPHTPPELLASRRINEVMRQVLDCFEGDRHRGLPEGVPLRKGLRTMMEEFGVQAGLAIKVTTLDGDLIETDTEA